MSPPTVKMRTSSSATDESWAVFSSSVPLETCPDDAGPEGVSSRHRCDPLCSSGGCEPSTSALLDRRDEHADEVGHRHLRGGREEKCTRRQHEQRVLRPRQRHQPANRRAARLARLAVGRHLEVDLANGGLSVELALEHARLLPLAQVHERTQRQHPRADGGHGHDGDCGRRLQHRRLDCQGDASSNAHERLDQWRARAARSSCKHAATQGTECGIQCAVRPRV